ncbi:SOS response-associated peptidase [Niabella insulamsoli]|uniref:SOS response-associated peptidase n=1 Tax=Niabella insulamsoli TaxID=3144874 RepID=UPI0032001F8E
MPFNRPVASGFEYPDWPVLLKDNEGAYVNELMQWGFLPTYISDGAQASNFRGGYKDEKGKYHPPVTTLNAIAEEMQDKPMFKKNVGNRCLVLSSGFYEWKHVPKIGKSGKELKATDKIPHFIYLKDRPHFFMAGIYNLWTNRATGEVVPTFAICTTAANTLMQEIHNSKKRMPLILDEELAKYWLDPTLNEKQITEIAHFKISESEMDAYEVDKEFRTSPEPNKPRPNEDPQNLLL